MSYNSLKFGDVDSADYGIYITGEAVYNAPTRAVEMVDVAGRSGAIIIDQGRWNNIEISYPAGTFASTQTDFATAMTAFRNAIVSQTGYNRLTDTYHPEEYRMATYIDGLEVSPVHYGTAGEFEIRFNAKPQRWLVSGEEEITIASGASIPNPTLYESSPMLEVSGVGTITLGDYEITVGEGNGLYGTLVMSEATSLTGEPNYTLSGVGDVYKIDLGQSGKYSDGDTITLPSLQIYWGFGGTGSSDQVDSISSWDVGNASGSATVRSYSSTQSYPIYARIYGYYSNITFTAGTDSTITDTYTATVVAKVGGTSGYTINATADITICYSASDNIIYVYLDPTYTTTASGVDTIYAPATGVTFGAVTVDSTASYLGDPTYIDCDLGICYKIENDEVIDLNSYIDLGSDLPVLVPEENAVTYDNTITSLVIVPRWWQL